MRESEDSIRSIEVQGQARDSPDTRPRKIAKIVAAILMVPLLLLSGFAVISLLEKPDDVCSSIVGEAATFPIGQFYVEETDTTTAKITFSTVFCDAPPTRLRIGLKVDDEYSWFSFPNNESGTTLTDISGENIATIVYYDLEQNGRVELGDHLAISGLTPDTEYTIILIWEDTSDQLDSDAFATPSG
ncbi:MAG: hypothetical protein V3U51_04220 [Thermoplasmata archaeon]